MYQLALGGYLANKVTRALRPIETERTRFLDGLEPPLASSQRTRRARRLPQPAAGPANGGGSEVLSVVPPGGSSEAVCGERLRIDWNNRRALVRVPSLLSVGPDLRLSWPARMNPASSA